MKIALTYRKVGRGAAVPNYCWELARGFSRLWETWVFTRETNELPERVRIVLFPFAFRSKRVEYGLNSVLNRFLLGAFRAREGFDLVHTQDGDLIGGDVVTAHALLRVLFHVFRRSDPDHVAWLPRSALLWSEDFVYRTHRYRHIIVSSEKMRASLADEYGVRGEDVTLIRLGIDPDIFRPDVSIRAAFRAQYSLDPDAVILLHVSTDFERKGLRTILGCLQLLPREFVLVVAGRGREHVFQEMARKLGLSNRILFLGYQPNLERIYPAADVFLFPTEFDFFGYPVLEAMACGVAPVVASDAGVAELIRDGQDGYLISDRKNPDALADQVLSAISSGEIRRVGRRARSTAERISITRMIDETKQVYEGLMRR